MSEMNNLSIKSFKITESAVELYEDKEGGDCAVVLPKWILNQIFEKCFDVKIAPSSHNAMPIEGE